MDENQMIIDASVLINLNDERDAYIIKKPENMVHMRALYLIQQRISESLEKAKKHANDKINGGTELLRVRTHDTIMLAGVRGSGKTTFMLSVLNFIENKGKTRDTARFIVTFLNQSLQNTGCSMFLAIRCYPPLTEVNSRFSDKTYGIKITLFSVRSSIFIKPELFDMI